MQGYATQSARCSVSPRLRVVRSRGAQTVVSAGWFARRVLLIGYTLLVVSVVVFAITEILPADAAVVILGQNATPAALAAVRARLGLNDPALAAILALAVARAARQFRHVDAHQSAGRAGAVLCSGPFASARRRRNPSHAADRRPAWHRRRAWPGRTVRSRCRHRLLSRRLAAGIRHRDATADRLRRPARLAAGNRLCAAHAESRAGAAATSCCPW